MHCTYASDRMDVFLGLLWMTKSFAHNKRKRNRIAVKRKPSADVNTKAIGKHKNGKGNKTDSDIHAIMGSR